MTKATILIGMALLTAAAVAIAFPAQAQSVTVPARPQLLNAYGVPQSPPSPYSNWRYYYHPPQASPFAPAYAPPPRAYFYQLGAQAFAGHDYVHAIEMFKTAASWSSKPAAYSLGVMYFRGDGVVANRSLGTAWMMLAAERGDPGFVAIRDAMASQLSADELSRANEYRDHLQQTFGDQVTLRRANLQQKQAGTARMTWTGTHWTRG